MIAAETKISNFGMTVLNPQITISYMLNNLMGEASEKLSVGKKEIQNNLITYFKKQDGHVNLVEKYREEFVASAKTLKQETENTVSNTLHGAVEIRGNGQTR